MRCTQARTGVSSSCAFSAEVPAPDLQRGTRIHWRRLACQQHVSRRLITASPPLILGMHALKRKGGTLQKHATLCFDDGDIALAAPLDATSKQMFLVHRVLLAHHSEVFRDMFVVAHEADAKHHYDGAPLVALPDRAEDVADLLDVMYNVS